MTQERNLKNQTAYQERKRGAGFIRRYVWLDRDADTALTELAEKRGMINATGKRTGQPSISAAIGEAIKAGLKALGM